MIIKELTIDEFNNFSKNHPLSSFYQTHEYAMVMAEQGYNFDLIGYLDGEEIIAGGLILYKKLSGVNYGYCPRGFLIDYNNINLLESFTKKLRDYYYEKEFAFIKINPNVQIGKINKENVLIRNENYKIKDSLHSLGYYKLKDNLYFESMLPRYSPIIDLKHYNSSLLYKNTRNKIKKSIRKGLIFKKTDISHISYLDLLVHSKNFYYNDLYNTFSKNDNAELFIVYIDKNKFLENSQNSYIVESENNHLLNDKMVKVSHTKNINKKMNSDEALLAYKKDVNDAINLSKHKENILVAAALVIKNNNTVNIVTSGYDKNYKRFAPNYFLHYNIIKYYQKKVDFININGVCGDLSETSPYKGLNDFKLGFSPQLFENIGEFDLIISDSAYKYLLKNKSIQKEFSKKL